MACHRKYGDACPHLERHSKAWTDPKTSVPAQRSQSSTPESSRQDA